MRTHAHILITALASVVFIGSCGGGNCFDHPGECALKFEVRSESKILYKGLGGKLSIIVKERPKLGHLTAQLIQLSSERIESDVKELQDQPDGTDYVIEFTKEDIKNFAPDTIAMLNVQESGASGSASIRIKLRTMNDLKYLDALQASITDKFVQVGIYQNKKIATYIESGMAPSSLQREIIHYIYSPVTYTVENSVKRPYGDQHSNATSLAEFSASKALIARSDNPNTSMRLFLCDANMESCQQFMPDISSTPPISAIALSQDSTYYVAAHMADPKVPPALPSVDNVIVARDVRALLPWPGIKILKLTDLNGDLLDDVIAIKPDGCDLVVCTQNSDKSFSRNTDIETALKKAACELDPNNPAPAITGMGIGDLNSDGESDVLIARGQQIYPVLVSGQYLTPQTRITAAAEIVGLAVGQVDGEGALDLAMISKDNLHLYLGQSTQ